MVVIILDILRKEILRRKVPRTYLQVFTGDVFLVKIGDGVPHDFLHIHQVILSVSCFLDKRQQVLDRICYYTIYKLSLYVLI